MNINLVYYSPTGTSQKIAQGIASGFKNASVREINITPIDFTKPTAFSTDDLTLFVCPVYAGRLPAPAVDRLNTIHSNGGNAVVVVVYGNRDFDDSLLELSHIVIQNGFTVRAGAAFIGEHSFSSSEKPIALQRPDSKDQEQCMAFAELIQKNISAPPTTPLQLPGNHPYKDRKKFPAEFTPRSDTERCHLCGHCLSVCPTGAISLSNNRISTDGNLCTWCCACIKSCPSGGRFFDNPLFLDVQERLFTQCSMRKEPVFFI